jgi:pimeloyl-ACP methyl ester carboxylesterase
MSVLGDLARKEGLIRLAGLVVVAYVVLCILVYLAQRRLIYLPSRAAVPLPAGFEAWLAPADGERWGYQRVAGSKQCLVFFHGNGGNASGWAHAVEQFPGDVFVLEYPGYGGRPGSPTEHTIKEAARTGFAAVEDRYETIVVAGQSLGGAVTEAIFARWPERIHRLVLIAPFTSLSAMARRQFPFLPTRWLLRDKMELFEPWQKFAGRTTVVIAGRDEIIPRALALRYMQGTNGRVTVVEQPEATHNSIDLDREFWRKTLE